MRKHVSKSSGLTRRSHEEIPQYRPRWRAKRRARKNIPILLPCTRKRASEASVFCHHRILKKIYSSPLLNRFLENPLFQRFCHFCMGDRTRNMRIELWHVLPLGTAPPYLGQPRHTRPLVAAAGPRAARRSAGFGGGEESVGDARPDGLPE